MNRNIIIGIISVVLIVCFGFWTFGGKSAGESKTPTIKQVEVAEATDTDTGNSTPSVEEATKNWDDFLKKSAEKNGGIFREGLKGSGPDQVELMNTPTRLVVVASKGNNIKVWKTPSESVFLPPNGWVVVFYKPLRKDYASVTPEGEAKRVPCPFGTPPEGAKFGVFQSPEFPMPEERRAAGKAAHAEGYFVEGAVPSPEDLRKMFPLVRDVEVIEKTDGGPSRPNNRPAATERRRPRPPMANRSAQTPT